MVIEKKPDMTEIVKRVEQNESSLMPMEMRLKLKAPDDFPTKVIFSCASAMLCWAMLDVIREQI